jgi:nitroimidazol reductase NimA-like FMN-containing flavoprotein (pyridoxamine 5'-phosphate oxidase superfamily)
VLDTLTMVVTELGDEECWQLLARSAVGRVALVRRGLPAVLPVNVHASDEALWFRVGPGPLLDAALANDVVTVEADDVDHATHAGWSVLVSGRAEVVANRDDVPVAAWGRTDADHLVRVPAEVVTGRRLG